MFFEYPGGIAEISRGSSEPTTPGPRRRNTPTREGSQKLLPYQPAGRRRRGCDPLPGSASVFLELTGGGRSARPPANISHPS